MRITCRRAASAGASHLINSLGSGTHPENLPEVKAGWSPMGPIALNPVSFERLIWHTGGDR